MLLFKARRSSRTVNLTPWLSSSVVFFKVYASERQHVLLNGYVISSLLFVFNSVSVYFTCNLNFFFRNAIFLIMKMS